MTSFNFLSLFPYVRKLEKINKDSKIIIDFLDFTIGEMKKEMVEREISQTRYLAKIDQLEKMDKLEKKLEEMFRKY